MIRTPEARLPRRAALRALAALLLAGATATPALAGPALRASPGGTLLVANQASASATIVDLATGSTTHLEVGTGPHEAAISADGRVGVVTIYGAQTPGNGLAVIDLAARRVVRTIDLGEFTRPHDVAFLPGTPRTVAVTSETTQRVVLVDVEAGRVVGTAGTGAAGSHMLGVSADGRRLFTANIVPGSISEIALPARELVREIPVSERTEGIAVSPDGGEAWVGSNTLGTVSVVDTRDGTVAARLTGFDFPYRLAIAADGRTAVVCDARVGKLHVIDVATREVRRVVEGIGGPRGVVLSADGGTAFVTLGPQGEALVIDLGSGAVVRRLGVGASPDGIAFTPVAHPAPR